MSTNRATFTVETNNAICCPICGTPILPSSTRFVHGIAICTTCAESTLTGTLIAIDILTRENLIATMPEVWHDFHGLFFYVPRHGRQFRSHLMERLHRVLADRADRIAHSRSTVVGASHRQHEDHALEHSACSSRP
jgi:ribosomal protein L37AE/L43A